MDNILLSIFHNLLLTLVLLLLLSVQLLSLPVHSSMQIIMLLRLPIHHFILLLALLKILLLLSISLCMSHHSILTIQPTIS